MTILRLLSIAALSLIVTVAASTNSEAERAKTAYQGMTYVGTSPSDIEDLRKLGANLVSYQLVLPDTSDDLTLDQYTAAINGRLASLDVILAKAEELGMKVLVNLHTPPGGFESRTSPAQHRIFSDKNFQDAFVQLWGQIAQRYATRTGIYAYDLLNEPAQKRVAPGVLDWNSLAPVLVSKVREFDTTHRILVMPLYGNPDKFVKLKPVKGDNVGYNFHQYFTSSFRTQGFGGRAINVLYPKGNFNNAALIRSVSKAVAFQRKTKAPMMCGEFAAPRWAFKNSALRYFRDNIRIFRKNGWDWAYHAWRESDAWSVEFTNDPNDHSPSATPTDREKLFQGFFASNT